VRKISGLFSKLKYLPASAKYLKPDNSSPYIHDLFSYHILHHNQKDFSAGEISSSQRPLTINTNTDNTFKPTISAAAVLRLRPRGHWDRQSSLYWARQFSSYWDQQFSLYCSTYVQTFALLHFFEFTFKMKLNLNICRLSHLCI